MTPPMVPLPWGMVGRPALTPPPRVTPCGIAVAFSGSCLGIGILVWGAVGDWFVGD